MTFNEYQRDVLDAACEYIREAFEDGTFDADTDFDDAYDEMFVSDAVTGNASGSYYFNSAKSREAVKDVIFDEDVIGEFDNFGMDVSDYLKRGDAEGLDVCVRCIALGYVRWDVEREFDEYLEVAKEEAQEEEDEEEEDE